MTSIIKQPATTSRLLLPRIAPRMAPRAADDSANGQTDRETATGSLPRHRGSCSHEPDLFVALYAFLPHCQPPTVFFPLYFRRQPVRLLPSFRLTRLRRSIVATHDVTHAHRTMRRTLITLLACALVQSSSALVLTGLRAPTVRARLGVRQLQARLSEEDGGAVCVIPEDDDVQL